MLQVAAMLPQSASIAVQYTDIIKILNFNTLYIDTYTLQLFKKHKLQNLSMSVILCIKLQLLC